MDSGAWVASDATTYSREEIRPDWYSLVSVAVATGDISEFNREYKEIVGSKIDKYGIDIIHLVLKSTDINRWTAKWDPKEVRADIVTDLLGIGAIDSIQITETSIHSECVEVFRGDENSRRRVNSTSSLKNASNDIIT